MTDLVFKSDMHVRLVDWMGSDLDVARAAWVSTKGERAQDEDDQQRIGGLINFLMRNRHGSPFEQCSLKFLTSAPIFVWREHMRHRIASYNEASGRYSKLEPVFYVPAPERPLVQNGKPGEYSFERGTEAQVTSVQQWLRAAATDAYAAYEEMLMDGIAKEVARMALPLNIYSSAYVTMNLRALMNFLSLRTRREDSTFPSFPQREIEMVAEEYERHFAGQFPLVFKTFNDNGRVAP